MVGLFNTFLNDIFSDQKIDDKCLLKNYLNPRPFILILLLIDGGQI